MHGKGMTMRKLTILLTIAVIALPAFAVHRVSVDQFHSWLAARKASNQSDTEIAKQISTLQLLERLSPSTLASLKAEFSPGPQTTQALDLLADCSAILDPPATELPSRPPPDVAALTAMIKSTVHFVGITMRQMPDFLATRITRSYDDNDPHVAKGMPDTTEDVSLIAPHNLMIPVGNFTQQITYRDGKEVPSDPKEAKQKHYEAPPGFSTRGEFGEILSIILLDAAKGKLAFSHWERMESEIVAVFHYQVPQAASHYAVDYCCLSAGQDRASGATYFGAGPTGGISHFVANEQFPGANQINDSYRGTPGYHGSIFIDPATGAILRITLDVELNPSEPITRNASSIDYGTVEIGGKKFICPVRSVAMSLTRAYLPESVGIRTILHINRTEFTSYHRFGSSVQVVASEEIH
jgi:hypothetical protein